MQWTARGAREREFSLPVELRRRSARALAIRCVRASCEDARRGSRVPAAAVGASSRRTSELRTNSRAGRRGARRGGLDDEVKVIGLDREVDDAERLAAANVGGATRRGGGAEGASERGARGEIAQVWHAAPGAERDVYRVRRLMEWAAAVRDVAAVEAGRLAVGTLALAAVRGRLWRQRQPELLAGDVSRRCGAGAAAGCGEASGFLTGGHLIQRSMFIGGASVTAPCGARERRVGRVLGVAVTASRPTLGPGTRRAPGGVAPCAPEGGCGVWASSQGGRRAGPRTSCTVGTQ